MKQGSDSTDLILGKYSLGSKHDVVGKGGFSTVYRAFDTTAGSQVALKVIPLSKKQEAASDAMNLTFEVEILSTLKHPNVVEYIEASKEKNNFIIVTELIEGGSLLSILDNMGSLDESLVAKYIYQTLAGLSFLHSQGVAHLDIKAANLLITKNGVVKLSDFGVSTILKAESTSEIHEPVGSPYWMSPEVAEGNGGSTASDIWSVAATVIELLTGKPPYFQYSPIQAMYRISEQGTPPIPSGISLSCEDFLRRCFVSDPLQRPTANDLLSHRFLEKAKRATLDAPGNDTLPKQSSPPGRPSISAPPPLSRRVSSAIPPPLTTTESASVLMNVSFAQALADTSYEFISKQDRAGSLISPKKPEPPHIDLGSSHNVTTLLSNILGFTDCASPDLDVDKLINIIVSSQAQATIITSYFPLSDFIYQVGSEQVKVSNRIAILKLFEKLNCPELNRQVLVTGLTSVLAQTALEKSTHHLRHATIKFIAQLLKNDITSAVFFAGGGSISLVNSLASPSGTQNSGIIIQSLALILQCFKPDSTLNKTLGSDCIAQSFLSNKITDKLLDIFDISKNKKLDFQEESMLCHAAHVFYVLSSSDSVIKHQLCSNSTLRRVALTLTKLNGVPLMNITAALFLLTTDERACLQLIRNNTFSFLIPHLDTSIENEVQLFIWSGLANVTKQDVHYPASLLQSGLLSKMSDIIRSDKPTYKPFVFPVFLRLGAVSDSFRTKVEDTKNLDLFTYALHSGAYFRSIALETMSIWLAKNPYKLVTTLIEPTNMDYLGIIWKEGANNKESNDLLIKMDKMFDNNRLAKKASKEAKFVAIIRDSLAVEEIIVRKSSLSVLTKMYHNSKDKYLFISTYQLSPVISEISTTDDRVIIKQLSDRLLHEWNIIPKSAIPSK